MLLLSLVTDGKCQMSAKIGALVAGIVVLLCAAWRAEAQERPAREGNAVATAILDTMGFWRIHHEMRPPAIQMAGQFKPALVPQSWMNLETAPAPAGWWANDFDDGGWFRGTALRAIQSPWLARLCVRGRFAVTDLEKADGLTLSVDYHGGIIVYVNGQELCRRNLPPGRLDGNVLAEAYPTEAFVDEQGIMLFPGNIRWHNPLGGDFWKDRKITPEAERRLGLMKRSLAEVAIPVKMLRKGVNVLAFEIIHSPYDAAVEEAHQKAMKKMPQFAYQIYLPTCELERVRLTAGGREGVVPNALRARGLQVWNSDPAAPDFDLDFGDASEPLRPISLVGPRNGAVSGKVVVGDTKPLRGLRATAGDLRGPGGAVIPAAAVRIRYGLPWGAEAVSEGLRRAPYPYPHPATPLACLSETAPAEIAVSTKDYPRYGPLQVKGAVASVWATVKVPPGAVPGSYAGQLTVEVQGEKATTVPLEVKVVDWLAPDPKDLTPWVDLIQSPDTLALEYGEPLWSPKHWEMIGHSLSRLGEAGNRTLYVPLIAHMNLGNEQSMVRWIRKGPDATGAGAASQPSGGEYEYDFTVLDRYLDSALKNMGKPEVVVCGVWDLYMLDPSGKLPEDERYTREMGGLRDLRQERMTGNIKDVGGKVGLGPLVTVLDPATGKTQTVELPKYTEAAAKAMWAPLMKRLREHLSQRGLDKALMFGMCTDVWAGRPIVKFFDDLLPGTPWVVQGHDGFSKSMKRLHGIAECGYQTRVWGVTFSDEDKSDPWRVNTSGQAGQAGRMYGWKQPERLALFERFSMSDFPATRWRTFAEVNTTGGQRGFGRVGADFWPVIKDKRGRRTAIVWERYPESSWRNLIIRTWVLAPGPSGPCATHRFEAMREGLIDCEARIEIEKALITPALREKMGEDLARRCQQHLDERLKFMWYSLSNFQMHAGGADCPVQYATGWRYAPGVYGQTWYIGSGWQQRTEALYRLAGEVATSLRSK